MKRLAIFLALLVPVLSFAQEAKFYLDGTADLKKTVVKNLDDYRSIKAVFTYPSNYKYYIAKVRVNVTTYVDDPKGSTNMVAQVSAPQIEKKSTFYYADTKKTFKKNPEYTFDLKEIKDLKGDPASMKISFSIDKLISNTAEGQSYVDGLIYSREVPIVFSIKTNPGMGIKGN